MRVRFGPFQVDADAGELRRDGERVPLQELPFRLLVSLLRAPGHVVLRDDLCRELWGDTVVEYEAGLNTAIRKLRDALGDDPTAPTWIETVPRRGYRFRGAVSAVLEEGELHTTPTTAQPSAQSVPHTSPQRPARRSHWTWLALTAGVVAALSLTSGRLRQGTGAPDETVRVLVMPVERSTSGDTVRDDALTDLTIAHLARVAPDRMAVLGPMTSKALPLERDQQAVVRSVGASHVLSIALSDTPTRVAVTLARVDDGAVTWSDVTDWPSGLAPDTWSRLLTTVARGVASALGIAASDPALARASTVSTPAFEAYLRGRTAWARLDADGLDTSLREFEQAVRLDPGFASAHVGLSEAHALRALYRFAPAQSSWEAAVTSATHALTVAGDDPTALAALGLAQLYADMTPAQSIATFERALTRDSGRALALQWAAGAYSASGDHAKAMALVERAHTLDPLSPAVNSDLCWYAYFGRSYRQAAGYAESAFRSFGRPPVLQCAQQAHWQLGDEEQERDVLLRRLSALGMPTEHGVLTDAFRHGGMAGFRAANEQRLVAGAGPADDYARAVAHMAAANTGPALNLLESLAPTRPPWMAFLPVDPSFDALRHSPRFSQLVETTNGRPDAQNRIQR